jgi:glycosyltransferase involved in cell wall biosynthesis
MDKNCGPSISVIIPVHKGGDAFRRCLLSVEKARPAPEEIIVVADGETDGAWRLAEKKGHQTIKISTPGGPARARNRGARMAKGEILFFVDADVTIPENAMATVRANFENDARLTALIGSYDDEPFEKNFLSQYKNMFHHYVHQQGKEDASTFWGACGAVRKDVFLKMGGFDEGYRRASIEDIELGYRLKRAGHSIRLVKGLQVKHLKRWGIGSLLKADIFYRAFPWTRLIFREGQFVDDLNLDMSSRVSVLCVFCLLLSLLCAFFWPGILALALFFVFMLFIMNRRMYLFFYSKRGFYFTVKVVPWHWVYFLYSGMVFGIGLIQFKIKQLFEKQGNPKGSTSV